MFAEIHRRVEILQCGLNRPDTDVLGAKSITMTPQVEEHHRFTWIFILKAEEDGCVAI